MGGRAWGSQPLTPQAPVLESLPHMWARKSTEGSGGGPRNPQHQQPQDHDLPFCHRRNSSGRLMEPILQMRKLRHQEFSSWPKAVLGELGWWSSPCKVIHLGPSVQKAQNPATEAVRAEALRPCPITARGAQLPRQRQSSPPQSLSHPGPSAWGRGAWSRWGLIPEPGQVTAGAESHSS